jgi:spore coat protein U-like protein
MHALTLAVALLSPHHYRPQPADSCTVTTNPLAFFPYDPSSTAPSYGLGALNFACGMSENVTIALSTGAGTYAQREMLYLSTNQLGYNIYTDFSFSTVWGDGTQGTQTVQINTGAEPLVPVFGRVPAQQSAIAGNYSDTITVTVSF